MATRDVVPDQKTEFSQKIVIHSLFPFQRRRVTKMPIHQSNYPPKEGAMMDELTDTEKKLSVYKPDLITGSKAKKSYSMNVLRSIALILGIEQPDRKENLAELIKETWKKNYPRSWQQATSVEHLESTSRSSSREVLSRDDTVDEQGISSRKIGSRFRLE